MDMYKCVYYHMYVYIYIYMYVCIYIYIHYIYIYGYFSQGGLTIISTTYYIPTFHLKQTNNYVLQTRNDYLFVNY